MEYLVQRPAEQFALPAEIMQKHIKFVNEICLKAVLWIYYTGMTTVTAEVLAAGIGCSVADAADALAYWSTAGLLATAKPTAAAAPSRRAVQAQVVKPTRAEVARRGLECPEIAFLLQEAQLKFGRGLRQNENSTLVWLYDDEGMDLALILMLLEYAGGQNKLNIGFIERTAVQWINAGIDTVAAAEAYMVTAQQSRTAWGIVESAMGIPHRAPSENELKLAHQWVDEWGYGREILRAAYNKCVDTTSKFSIPYIKKILEGWHKAGVKNLDDLAALDDKAPKSATAGASYDLSMEEQLMFTSEE